MNDVIIFVFAPFLVRLKEHLNFDFFKNSIFEKIGWKFVIILYEFLKIKNTKSAINASENNFQIC